MAFIVGKSVLPRGTPAHRLGYAVEHEQCTTAARCASTGAHAPVTGDAPARDKALLKTHFWTWAVYLPVAYAPLSVACVRERTIYIYIQSRLC